MRGGWPLVCRALGTREGPPRDWERCGALERPPEVCGRTIPLDSWAQAEATALALILLPSGATNSNGFSIPIPGLDYSKFRELMISSAWSALMCASSALVKLSFFSTAPRAFRTRMTLASAALEFLRPAVRAMLRVGRLMRSDTL